MGKVTVFKDGKLTDEECPETSADFCECGGGFDGSYGFTPYGLGLYMACKECSSIYNFVEDKEPDCE